MLLGTPITITAVMSEGDDGTWTADVATNPAIATTVTEGATMDDACRRGVTVILDELEHRADALASTNDNPWCETTIHARVLRVGGDAPHVLLQLETGERVAAKVDEALARRLAHRLYETVELSGLVQYDRTTLLRTDFRPTMLNDTWRDRHLADVVREHGGRLPLDLDVGSVAELTGQRTR